jgi:hypothetical protein
MAPISIPMTNDGMLNDEGSSKDELGPNMLRTDRSSLRLGHSFAIPPSSFVIAVPFVSQRMCRGFAGCVASRSQAFCLRTGRNLAASTALAAIR